MRIFRWLAAAGVVVAMTLPAAPAHALGSSVFA
jgi:hypothetical protein